MRLPSICLSESSYFDCVICFGRCKLNFELVMRCFEQSVVVLKEWIQVFNGIVFVLIEKAEINCFLEDKVVYHKYSFVGSLKTFFVEM